MSVTDCRRVLLALERYCDGEASEAERMELRVHLEECPDCAHRQEFIRELRVVIRRKCGTAELPPEVEARIRALLRPSA